jgi:hypothetical protein
MALNTGSPDHFHRPHGGLLGSASVGSPRPGADFCRLIPKPHDRLLDHYRAHRLGNGDWGRLGHPAATVRSSGHGAPGLPDLPPGYPWRLEDTVRGDAACAALSPSQGMGIRRRDLQLHRSWSLSRGGRRWGEPMGSTALLRSPHARLLGAAAVVWPRPRAELTVPDCRRSRASSSRTRSRSANNQRRDLTHTFVSDSLR